MEILAKILIGLSAVSHLGFLILEMFFWTKSLGMKVFRRTPSQAEESKSLAANQGLYNGFLAAGLLWSLFATDPVIAHQTATFFLSCVVAAGAYGGLTVNRRIFFVQGVPALVALSLALFV